MVWHVDVSDYALVVDDADPPELPITDTDLVRHHLVGESVDAAANASLSTRTMSAHLAKPRNTTETVSYTHLTLPTTPYV